MKYIILLLIMVQTTGLFAQDQQTQIKDVARKIIANTTPIKLTEPNSRVSPQAEQQIRRIADALSRLYSIPNAEPQTPTEPQPEISLTSRIKDNVLIGIMIFLALGILTVLLNKYGEKKTGGKAKNIIDINHTTRNAPYLIALTLPSQNEAEALAQTFITQHLIARADILPQKQPKDPLQEGVLIIAQTVKGRFKTLQKELQSRTLTPFPVPILRGHKDHLQWIVDTADGKG